MTVARVTALQVEMLAALPDELLRSLLQSAILRPLRRRELVWEVKACGQWVGWVVQGAVVGITHTVDGREAALWRCAPGEIFGEAEILSEQKESSHAFLWMASEANTSVIIAAATTWRQILRSDPETAWGALQRLAQQQQRLLALRHLLAEPNAALRVAAVLSWLAEQSEEAPPPHCPQWRYLPAGITQQEVAAYANTTRETVTRVMQRLQTSEIVARTSNGWIVNVKRLQGWHPTEAT